ncbi:MAG: hypothetical protein QXO77_04915 [Saccharolobus sp.]
MVVGGLDLAAYEHRCSGFAVIDEEDKVLKELTCLYSDMDIISKVKLFSIEILAIDAPIAAFPKFREVDREAIRRGFRVFPPTFKSMKMLTIRAWRLYNELKSTGVIVIETHPRSALKNSGVNNVIELCNRLSISIEQYLDKVSHRDLHDALISSLVAFCYKKKVCIESIEAEDGTIYVIVPLNQ